RERVVHAGPRPARREDTAGAAALDGPTSTTWPSRPWWSPASCAASTPQPTQASTPARTGAPDDDGDQVTPANLSAPTVPKTRCSGERDGAVERRHEGW